MCNPTKENSGATQSCAFDENCSTQRTQRAIAQRAQRKSLLFFLCVQGSVLSVVNDIMNFLPTIDIMRAMQTTLAALMLPAPRDGEKAFESVRMYAHENLFGALKELLLFDDRICLVVPVGNEHESKRDAAVITMRRTAKFVLLVSDRVYGDTDSEAALGSANAVGALALGEMVADAIGGQSLGLPNAGFLLGTGEPLGLSDDERNSAGVRECWALPVSTYAGETRTTLPRPSGRLA